MTLSSCRQKFRSPFAITEPSKLLFGIAPKPVEVGRGIRLGGGTVYPEINFTLPPMLVEESSWSEVARQYREMIDKVVRRAVALEVPGLVVEFEHLPPMTERPEWGAELTSILREALDRAHATSGLASAVRVTIVDLRDGTRPPVLRSGPHWESMRESFHLCASRGGDILSIESVGGKEVHDQALVFGDIRGIAYSLGVLAARDMEWLWTEIVRIANEEGCVPGGDSACGFANTAMQLANNRQVPEVLASVIRAMTAARSLVAYECGARGPSKDCAYEGHVLKVLCGCPLSMEGKSAACAHWSPVGNIASMAADLWSNESVQNVRLLSGSAPEAFLEILAYDCRLLNQATRRGQAESLRDLLVGSDESLSPQALILGPQATFEIAGSIATHADDDYRRTVDAGKTAVDVIRRALQSGPAGSEPQGLRLSESEIRWLDRIERELDGLPEDPEELAAEMAETYGTLFDPKSYGLGGD